MSSSVRGEITRLLIAWQAGEREALNQLAQPGFLFRVRDR